jgi:hypothetical protein
MYSGDEGEVTALGILACCQPHRDGACGQIAGDAIVPGDHHAEMPRRIRSGADA